VFREGRRSADRLFTVLYRRSGQVESRLGMTASARRIRGAVERNRLRRLIRESFRQATPELKGLDVVVVLRENAAAASNEEVFASLYAHWARLKSDQKRAPANG
jgi:ribonuclease P protein component